MTTWCRSLPCPLATTRLHGPERIRRPATSVRPRSSDGAQCKLHSASDERHTRRALPMCEFSRIQTEIARPPMKMRPAIDGTRESRAHLQLSSTLRMKPSVRASGAQRSAMKVLENLATLRFGDAFRESKCQLQRENR